MATTTKQRKVADFIERILCALIVAAVTYTLVMRMFGLESDGAGETAMLNAGLAYYTHQASGGLASVVASVAGFITYHLLRRWQKDRHQ